MSDPNSALTRNAALSRAALLTSSATLVCFVLPAVLMALAAGAALAGLTAPPIYALIVRRILIDRGSLFRSCKSPHFLRLVGRGVSRLLPEGSRCRLASFGRVQV